MNKTLTLASLVTFTIALFLTVADAQQWIDLPDTLTAAARWIFIGALSITAFKRNNLTFWILVSMFLGAEIGYDFPEVGKQLNIFSKIFIKLIKTIIAPLLLATLVLGIAGHSNLKQVGRMGLKSLIYFEVVTTIALVIGLVAINWSRAGDGITKPNAGVTYSATADQLEIKVDTTKSKEVKIKAYVDGKQAEIVQPPKKSDWKELVLHIFPENIAKSIAEGQVLQVVVFAILFAMAMMFVQEPHKMTMLHFLESLAEIMFKFTDFVMKLAPFAVGGAIAATVGENGVGILKNLGMLVFTLYAALIVFILVVFVPLMLWLKIPIKRFIDHVSEPATLAFATSSSESALPMALRNMEAFGVPRKIVSFVLPTGYSFNLDGSTLYLSLATVFVAQAAGMELSWGQQVIIVLSLMLTSKGVAGVSRASLVILAGTCTQFNLPDWPIELIFGVDVLMDMARTATNLVGNCLATAVISRWEGEGDF
jgi:proton glutamate symport protein